MNRWFVVTACAEVARGQVAQTQLLGQELVLWRTPSGMLNAWENRCPHRGVRLSLGTCAGEELRCQYHAWRFASGTGQCTYIPSHPNQKPASTIRPAVFGLFEDGVFAWANLDSGASPPEAATPSVDTALRSIFVSAPLAGVTQSLLRGYAGHPVTPIDEFTLEAVDPAGQDVRFMLQPVTATQTLIHARLRGQPPDSERIAILRHHNGLMSAVRDRAEASR